jgi:hypothetical protein
MGWVLTSRLGRFTPEKDKVPIVKEVEWAPGPVCTDEEYLYPHWVLIRGPFSP